jgi:hypothetical protein
VNKETDSTAMRTKIAENRKKSAPMLPMTELTEKSRLMHNTGCKTEERKTTLRSANDVVENTNKRRMSAKEKPKRKSLTQITGFSRKALMRLPRKMKPNHVKQEKMESAEQRLRLKTGSFLIKPR